MDVNYSRWMSKDPDAEPDVVEDGPRRFSLRWPTRSAVASTAMVSLIVLGGAAFVRSIATPEVTTDKAQTVETPGAEQSSGPGAASVDDSELDDSELDDTTSDEVTSDDDSISDSSTSDDFASDDSTTSDWSAPAGPPPGLRRMVRRELGLPHRVAPGPPIRYRRALRP